jgi:P-type Mg2+ transporter
LVLPFTSLGTLLGFAALPPTYFVFLIGVVGTYLVLVELAKRRLMRPFFGA